VRINPWIFIRSTVLLLPAIILVFVVSIANAQTTADISAQSEVAKASTTESTTGNDSDANTPVFTDYRGIRIGMSADEVRAKLERLKDGGPGQDFFVFSEKESAQIYYDEDRKVIAISVDYFGDNNSAPSPEAILGVELHAKPDGSMYQLNRYPDAGYWVSYNRTAGDKPIVTITMQKI
jgi:hypothetical protein